MPSAPPVLSWASIRSAARRGLIGSRSTSIYGLNIVVVNPVIDPTFSFMTVDHDGKIRMDCSSPYAMARLVGLKDQYQVAFANDPDSDRHGIVTPSSGLMNPNHYLAVAIEYLLPHRPRWGAHVAVGKTLVSSSMIDRVVKKLGRKLCEVPVGFQVVCAGTVRRLIVLRWRRERGRELPAPGRHGLDDRQGRPDHGLAGGRDHGAHGQGSRRALSRADGRVRHAVLHAHRCAGHSRAEGESAETVTRGGQGIQPWLASRLPRS